MAKRTLERCWPTTNPLLIAYHDREWGVPVHDDRALFEMLILQTMQAGLSWTLILAKREGLREAFDGFQPERVARSTRADLRRLLADPRVIHNLAKIEATVENARRFLRVQEEFGSFDRFIWQFVGGSPIRHRFHSLTQIPSQTKESQAMSKELLRRGFRFTGPVVCYAYMQATGMVNDHLVSCFRYHSIESSSRKP